MFWKIRGRFLRNGAPPRKGRSRSSSACKSEAAPTHTQTQSERERDDPWPMHADLGRIPRRQHLTGVDSERRGRSRPRGSPLRSRRIFLAIRPCRAVPCRVFPPSGLLLLSTPAYIYTPAAPPPPRCSLTVCFQHPHHLTVCLQ
jgi:hypothetical protein